MKIQNIKNVPMYAFRGDLRKNKFPEKIVQNKELAVLTLGIAGLSSVAIVSAKNPSNQYKKMLSEALTKELNKTIKPFQLKSVMSPDEFLRVTQTLKEENYIASKNNVEKGIFVADFHTHSDYSDGRLCVKDILNQAVEYGNKLNKINGKKFMFALSDHDGVDGVKEVLKIIVHQPERYKNIKFIPSVELSFPIKSEKGSVKNNQFHNDVEMAEILLYGINPFSDNTNEYFRNLYNIRQKGIEDSVRIISEKINDVKFFADEFNKYYQPLKTKYCMLNQHWNFFNYVVIKSWLSRLAKPQNLNPENMYNSVMSQLDKYGGRQIGSLNRFLSDKQLAQVPEEFIEEIKKYFSKIVPSLNGEKIIAPYESSFEKISEYANKENSYMAFAHPGFMVQNMNSNNIKNKIKKYIDSSDKKLVFSENYHQAYPLNNISKTEIDKTNKYMKELGLIPIGGRDKHDNNFIF